MRDLLVSPVVERFTLRPLAQLEKQVDTDDEDEDVTMVVLKGSICKAFPCHRRRELGVLNNIVFSVFSANDADLFRRVSLRHRFQRSLMLVFVGEADLHRV